MSEKMQEKYKKTSENAGTPGNFCTFIERWTLENVSILD